MRFALALPLLLASGLAQAEELTCVTNGNSHGEVDTYVINEGQTEVTRTTTFADGAMSEDKIIVKGVRQDGGRTIVELRYGKACALSYSSERKGRVEGAKDIYPLEATIWFDHQPVQFGGCYSANQPKTEREQPNAE